MLPVLSFMGWLMQEHAQLFVFIPGFCSLCSLLFLCPIIFRASTTVMQFMQLRSTPPLSPSSEKDSGGPCHKPLCRAHYCFRLSTYALKTTVGSASKALSLPDPLGLDLANLDHVTLANKAHCGDKDLSLLSLSHMGTEKQRDHFNMSFLLQSGFSG